MNHEISFTDYMSTISDPPIRLTMPTAEEEQAMLVRVHELAEQFEIDPIICEVAGFLAYFHLSPEDTIDQNTYTIHCMAIIIRVQQYAEGMNLFRTPEQRAVFLKTMPKRDLLLLRNSNLMNDTEFEALLQNPAPTIYQFLGAFLLPNLLSYCMIYLESLKSNAYRTKAQADEAIHEIPSALAVPTMQNYQYVMSLKPFGNAYMQPLASTDGLKFSDGRMYFIGNDMQPVSEVQLQNMVTNEGIDSIDLGMLRIFYSIILTEFEKTKCKEIHDVITLYIPDLAESMGLQRNINKAGIQRLIDNVQSFHNIVGVMHGTRNNKPSQSLYPVLNFEGYDDKKNTISFSSPYMNMVIKTVYKLAIRKDKDGEPKLSKRGEPLRIATHSFLTKASIVKERNKTAIENVLIIVQLIEQCGNQEPHISAQTIIERNPLLEKRLQQTRNKTTLLKRTFETTWRILREQTYLTERYQDIVLPDPNDPGMIPSIKNLETIVFTFPHRGKK